MTAAIPFSACAHCGSVFVALDIDTYSDKFASAHADFWQQRLIEDRGHVTVDNHTGGAPKKRWRRFNYFCLNLDEIPHMVDCANSIHDVHCIYVLSHPAELNKINTVPVSGWTKYDNCELISVETECGNQLITTNTNSIYCYDPSVGEYHVLHPLKAIDAYIPMACDVHRTHDIHAYSTLSLSKELLSCASNQSDGAIGYLLGTITSAGNSKIHISNKYSQEFLDSLIGVDDYRRHLPPMYLYQQNKNFCRGLLRGLFECAHSVHSNNEFITKSLRLAQEVQYVFRALKVPTIITYKDDNWVLTIKETRSGTLNTNNKRDIVNYLNIPAPTQLMEELIGKLPLIELKEICYAASHSRKIVRIDAQRIIKEITKNNIQVKSSQWKDFMLFTSIISTAWDKVVKCTPMGVKRTMYNVVVPSTNNFIAMNGLSLSALEI